MVIFIVIIIITYITVIFFNFLLKTNLILNFDSEISMRFLSINQSIFDFLITLFENYWVIIFIVILNYFHFMKSILGESLFLILIIIINFHFIFIPINLFNFHFNFILILIYFIYSHFNYFQFLFYSSQFIILQVAATTLEIKSQPAHYYFALLNFYN